MNCRNTTAGGCMCPDHAPGLSTYSRDQDAYTAALNRCRPSRVVLSVLTRDDILSVEKCCDQTMTCICRECSRDRQERKMQSPSQPWQPKAPRHQRAA